MKQLLLAIVPVLALSALATGCSSGSNTSPFGSDPDFASIKTRMQKPDGTFDAHNASNVFSQYSTQQTGQSSADVAGASSSAGGGAAAQGYRYHSNSLRILGGTSTGPAASCSDLSQGHLNGSCACPGGGTFAYDFSELEAAQQSSQHADATLRVAMNQCQSENGDLVDGKEFVHAHIDNTATSKNESMIMVLDASVRTGGVTHQLDVNADLEVNDQGTSVGIAVQVDDGWVVVQAAQSSDGTSSSFIVKDKNGSWSCSVTGNAGSCTDPSGKATAFTKS